MSLAFDIEPATTVTGEGTFARCGGLRRNRRQREKYCEHTRHSPSEVWPLNVACKMRHIQRRTANAKTIGSVCSLKCCYVTCRAIDSLIDIGEVTPKLLRAAISSVTYPPLAIGCASASEVCYKSYLPRLTCYFFPFQHLSLSPSRSYLTT